jgi:hypothetical protein
MARIALAERDNRIHTLQNKSLPTATRSRNYAHLLKLHYIFFHCAQYLIGSCGKLLERLLPEYLTPSVIANDLEQNTQSD